MLLCEKSLLIMISLLVVSSCGAKVDKETKSLVETKQVYTKETQQKDYKSIVTDTSLALSTRLVAAAQLIIDPSIQYDPTYRSIPYPMGDVPSHTGVCTDVVVRAYRILGIDLQQLVHEDMMANFNLYPSRKLWGLKSTDKNIDHRRVPNLQRFFERKGIVKSKSLVASDYLPGDIVAWKLPNGLLHIGIIIDEKSKDSIPLVVHNIGRGQIAENVLFAWDIIGHYSYSK